jgi:lysyl endopeptidase
MTSRINFQSFGQLTKFAFAILVSAFLAACGGGGGGGSSSTSSSNPQPTAAADTMVVRVDSGGTRTVALSADMYIPPASKALSKPAPEAIARRPIPNKIDLGAPEVSKSKALQQGQQNRPVGVPLQVGFARESALTSQVQETTQLLQWTYLLNGGSVAALEFKSDTAAAIRIGILIESLPDTATLRFYGNSTQRVVEVTGQLVNSRIKGNVEAGDQSVDGKTYWGPAVEGNTAIFEIELAPNTQASSVKLSIPKISHLESKPFTKSLELDVNQAKDIGSAGTCNANVSCETPLPPISNAVAYMFYSKGANSYECTGTLMNDVGSTGTPYFLTAYHCIDSQTAASTLETAWFARTSACATTTINPSAVVYDGANVGATFLWGQSARSGANGANPAGTDTSFLRLNVPAPQGAVFAGWTAGAQNTNTSIAAIHHPSGDLQKISKGIIDSYSFTSDWGNASNGSFNTLSSVNQNSWPLYRVLWTSGVTEGGSSGGGLFLNYAGNAKLVGQLLGGSSSCQNPTARDVYGRFDLAYEQRLNTWLSPNSSPVYRFFHYPTSSYFFTNSVVERDVIRNLYSQFFRYEAPIFMGSPAAGNGLKAVYRFRNLTNGSYLWTISEVERISILQNFSRFFVEENIAWYTRDTPAPGWAPVYRFRDMTNGAYLLTASQVERQSILTNFGYKFAEENIAFYVVESR